MYPQLIQQFLQSGKLPATYGEDAVTWLLPFAGELQTRLSAPEREPFLLGISGAQGTGKSTFSNLLKQILEQHQLRVCCVSIDDFYLGRQARQELAASIHPLLATRGVPGTHDVALLENCLSRLLSGDGPGSVALPAFDKATDDRIPVAEFPRQALPLDLVILEGWFIGATAATPASLAAPINALEASEDGDGKWRDYVNECLRRDYEPLFAQFDALVVLQAPSFDQVHAWRGVQEEKLRQTSPVGSRVMNEAELSRFIQHFERITRRCIELLPGKADVLFRLDESHRFIAREDSGLFRGEPELEEALIN